MKFVGVDLAWSYKNPSGVTVLEGDEKRGKVIAHSNLYTDKEIIDFAKTHIGKDNAIIAIDAPLKVPNKKGRRQAEAITGYLFRKYHAGAHPSNRERLGQWNNGKVRGEVITKLFEKEGYKHDPCVKPLKKQNKVIEVYPHPSIVVLFGLDKILKYKNKPKRDYDFRWGEFERYRQGLNKLRKPSIKLPKEILTKNIRELKGQKLKDFEDVLDSIMCAYIVHYYWVHGKDKCAVLGDLKKGYIMTPIFEYMKDKLKEFELNKKSI